MVTERINRETDMDRGLFISFEGPDGSGKSTQIEFLKEFFQEIEVPCVFTREPGGTHIGEEIREIILDKHNNDMSDLTEAFLYAASRSQHVEQVIRPALERGFVVVCDRFVDSSIAYQGYARGLGNVVAEINRLATGNLLPDVTFFFDIDPKISKKRISSGERDRLESEKIRFHRKVYQGYKALAENEPDRIVTVNGTETIEEMRDFILSHIRDILQERGVL
jgi:dTMP kinase